MRYVVWTTHYVGTAYRSGEFLILYDPAGPVEGERGGWYVWKGTRLLGMRFTLADAKVLAEANQLAEANRATELDRGAG
jgi:hypothetical protein